MRWLKETKEGIWRADRTDLCLPSVGIRLGGVMADAYIVHV